MTEPTPTDPMAALRALAQQPRSQECAWCGKVFEARGRGLYCSEACRQAAKYLRTKQRRAAEGVTVRHHKPKAP